MKRTGGATMHAPPSSASRWVAERLHAGDLEARARRGDALGRQGCSYWQRKAVRCWRWVDLYCLLLGSGGSVRYGRLSTAHCSQCTHRHPAVLPGLRGRLAPDRPAVAPGCSALPAGAVRPLGERLVLALLLFKPKLTAAGLQLELHARTMHGQRASVWPCMLLCCCLGCRGACLAAADVPLSLSVPLTCCAREKEVSGSRETLSSCRPRRKEHLRSVHA